jgi:hypothetical protein
VTPNFTGKGRRATVTLVGRSLVLALILAAAPAMTAAQSLASARTFVAGLYDRYGRSEPEYAGRDAGATFSAKLVRLIREDQARAKGEVGALDGDPICDCQDPGGLKLIGLDVVAAGSGKITAVARVRFPDSAPMAIRLDLVASGTSWRVSDVHTADMPSLVGLLQTPQK